jgi:hypothetical protein
VSSAVTLRQKINRRDLSRFGLENRGKVAKFLTTILSSRLPHFMRYARAGFELFDCLAGELFEVVKGVSERTGDIVHETNHLLYKGRKIQEKKRTGTV